MERRPVRPDLTSVSGRPWIDPIVVDVTVEHLEPPAAARVHEDLPIALRLAINKITTLVGCCIKF